jgi:predicted MPP superfamily phosphohydrolase
MHTAGRRHGATEASHQKTARLAALARRIVRLWQIGANLLLLGVAASLVSRHSLRALVIAALVPIAFTPFSYARLQVHDRLALLCRRSTWPAPILVVLVVLGMVTDALMLAQLLTARAPMNLPVIHAPGVNWVGPVWFSTHALWLIGHLLVAPLRRATPAVARVWRRHAVGFSEPRVSLERRAALQQIGILGVGAPFAVSLSGVSLSYDFRVEEHEIVLQGWPCALDGLRVAHLSDIHVGGAMNRERLLRVAELTNEARPDLVVHSGDFLTHRGGDFDAPLYEALARINAPFGQWACLGNHDFDDPERLVRRLRDAGVVTLRGQAVTLSVQGTAIEIAGIDFIGDRLRRAAWYERIIGRWRDREGRFRLLLNHDPSAFGVLPDGCADLICSGHTHGGHIGVQLGSTAVTVVGLLGIPDQGLFQRGDMRLFVTRCVGFYGYPIRLGIPPEISLLTLRAA